MGRKKPRQRDPMRSHAATRQVVTTKGAAVATRQSTNKIDEEVAGCVAVHVGGDVLERLLRLLPHVHPPDARWVVVPSELDVKVLQAQIWPGTRVDRFKEHKTAWHQVVVDWLQTCTTACPRCNQLVSAHAVQEIGVNHYPKGSMLWPHVDRGKWSTLLLLVQAARGGGDLRVVRTAAGLDAALWRNEVTAGGFKSPLAQRYRDTVSCGLHCTGDACVIDGSVYLHEVTAITAGERISLACDLCCPKVHV